MSKTRQNLPVPSFASLRAFECAARHGSFTLAAEELHLTQSAVSRQVKDLEAMLGFTLFRRNGRRVALSDAGADFASELAIDLERLKQTVTRAVAAGNARSALRIATLSTFACRWLIPPHNTAAHGRWVRPFHSWLPECVPQQKRASILRAGTHFCALPWKRAWLQILRRPSSGGFRTQRSHSGNYPSPVGRAGQHV